MRRLIYALLMSLLVIPMPVFAQSEEELVISAASAILIEADSGRVLYEKDSRVQRPMASTTKIMTALVAARLSNPEEVLCIQPDCVKIEGSSLYLEENEELTMVDMLYGLLLRSGNDAAAAIGKHCAGDVRHFVSLMNSMAWQMGMANTNFVNPHGLDHEEHYSTALDMAILGAAFLDVPMLRDICMCEEYISRELRSGKVRLFRNNNKLLIRDPRSIGIKIGWTDNAGRCLVAAGRVGDMELIAVVLDAPDLYSDVSKLFDLGFGQFKLQELVPQGKVMAILPVVHGSERRVALATAESVSIPVIPNESVTFTVETKVPQRVTAPIQAGQVMGTARVTVDGTWEIDVDLVAETGVRFRPGIWSRLTNWVRAREND